MKAVAETKIGPIFLALMHSGLKGRRANTWGNDMRGTVLFLAVFIFFGAPTWAATTQVGNCMASNVQAAINAASAGDTILVPTGSCAWSSAITITKGINLIGAGQETNGTVITTSSLFFEIPHYAFESGNFRISGFRLLGGTSGGKDISIDGPITALRVDHMTFRTASTQAVVMGMQANDDYLHLGTVASQKSLFDHIDWQGGTGQQFMLLFGRGYLPWTEDDGWGTGNYVFIEDSTFTQSTDYWLIDSEMGGRYVFRYNTVTNSSVIQHDMGSTGRGRGTRAVEVYNNTFNCTLGGDGCYTPMNATRGGSGLFYNNTITGNYRETAWDMIWRVTDATSYIGGGYCSQTGTRKVCQDWSRHCTAGTHRPCTGDGYCTGNGTCRTTYECTTDADCGTWNGGTGRCIQIDGSLSNGYPCRDQTGRGKDDPTTGVQADAPVYWWNNTKGDRSVNLNISGLYSYYIQEGRDFCNHSPATTCGTKAGWTYTAYTYPHPLQDGGGVALASPSNLRIMQ